MTARALLTIPETAARLCICRTSVYPLIHAGELKTVPVGANGKHLRVIAESVDEVIARRAAPTKKRGRAA